MPAHLHGIKMLLKKLLVQIGQIHSCNWVKTEQWNNLRAFQEYYTFITPSHPSQWELWYTFLVTVHYETKCTTYLTNICCFCVCCCCWLFFFFVCYRGWLLQELKFEQYAMSLGLHSIPQYVQSCKQHSVYTAFANHSLCRGEMLFKCRLQYCTVKHHKRVGLKNLNRYIHVPSDVWFLTFEGRSPFQIILWVCLVWDYCVQTIHSANYSMKKKVSDF